MFIRFYQQMQNDGDCGKCEDEALEKLIAEHDAQIRADEQAFVEKRCKELGIDYILIYTCDSAD